MKTVRAEGCAKPLSKHERLLANLRQFYSPFDKLRANVARVDEMIINRLLETSPRARQLAWDYHSLNYPGDNATIAAAWETDLDVPTVNH